MRQIPTRKSRNNKVVKANVNVVTPSKYYEQKASKLKEFVLTPKQQEFNNTINSSIITFVDSVAGTGKSSVVLHNYCTKFIKDLSTEIVVIRTPAESGEDKLGFLPNGVDEKLAPHFVANKNILDDFLGKGVVDNELGKRIRFSPPNFELGVTWDNAYVLIDEAQMMGSGTLELLLTRIGNNTKVVVAGCSNQIFTNDGKKRDGLSDAIHRFFTVTDEYVEQKYDDIAFFEFGIEDVMRSDIVKSVIQAYHPYK